MNEKANALAALLADIEQYTPETHPPEAAFRRQLLQLTKDQPPLDTLADRHDDANAIYATLVMQFKATNSEAAYTATKGYLATAIRHLVESSVH